MSTRGIIARVNGATPFTGRYHHSDSYPSGLGKTLYDAYNGYFQRDSEAMMRLLIDEHPAGWSYIIDSDFSLEPGFSSPNVQYDENFDENYDAYKRSELGRRPHCYCHGERTEAPITITTFEEAYKTWAVYMYVIDTRTDRMTIFGLHGRNDWRNVINIALRGNEPDWNTLDQK